MTRLTPQQAAWRRRVEGLIRLAAPGLDLVLTVGDRVSRMVEPTDHEHYPIRAGGESGLPSEFEAPSRATGEDDAGA